MRCAYFNLLRCHHTYPVPVQQIKNWFNNRGRGADLAKGGRGDLKLDVNERRKLAPIQAYCSYAWESTLWPIVLSRWGQQKHTVTFADDDDPLSETEVSSEEACIPLAFKLKIVKEMYEQLSQRQKNEIDERREEDRKKLYRKITDIPDDGERKAKLRIHNKYVNPHIFDRLSDVFGRLGISLRSQHLCCVSSRTWRTRLVVLPRFSLLRLALRMENSRSRSTYGHQASSLQANAPD